MDNENQLKITSKGDTLETGFWRYDGGSNGVSKSGLYLEGFKIDKWTYRTDFDSADIVWSIFNDKGVKFNVADHLKVIKNLEQPILFQADVEDRDSNTYLVLLKYNLRELNSSAYDYLYQYDQSWKKSSDILISKEYKKFIFKNIVVFRAKVATEIKITNYEAISYIFVVNDFLYDLTYKHTMDKGVINLEIFNDVFYSMECDSVDLFDYNSKKYLKEESIEFK